MRLKETCLNSAIAKVANIYIAMPCCSGTLAPSTGCRLPNVWSLEAHRDMVAKRVEATKVETVTEEHGGDLQREVRTTVVECDPEDVVAVIEAPPAVPCAATKRNPTHTAVP